MNPDHHDLGTGAPRLRRTASVAPAVLGWLVATLLLLGGAPPGHAQEDSEPALGTVDDQTFLKDQAVDIDRTTPAVDPVVLPAATGGDGTLTYTLECAASETGCDPTSKLPPGLAFAAASRELSGTPTTSGTWDMVYTVTDADTTDPDSDSATFEIKVLDEPVLSIDDSSVVEGGPGERPQMVFTVSLSPASARTVTVRHQDAGGGSSGLDVGVDYDTASMFGTLSSATGTIRNDDNLLTLGAERREEGDDGTTTLTFTLKLFQPAGSTGVKVFYRDVTGEAGVSDPATSGDDYTAISDGQVVFAPGEDGKTVEVSVIADRDNEPDERIVLEFHDPKHALFGDGAISERATAVVVNDDGASQLVRTLSIDSPSVDEGDDGTTTLTFTVTRSGGTQSAVSVDYADAGTGGPGTATSGEDYEAISAGTLTFEDGETSKTIDVTVNGDTAVELDETVVIILSDAMNAELPEEPAGTGTITNDDIPVVTVDSPSVTEATMAPPPISSSPWA